jgi:hypothetical protein
MANPHSFFLILILRLVSTGPWDTETNGAQRDRGVGLQGLRAPVREVSSLLLYLGIMDSLTRFWRKVSKVVSVTCCRYPGVKGNLLLPDVAIIVGHVLFKNIWEWGKEKPLIVCTKRKSNLRDNLRKNKDCAKYSGKQAFLRKYAHDSKYFLGKKYFSRLIPLFSHVAD